MSIVVTGSVAYDYLLSFPGRFREHILPEHLDKLSVSFLVDSKQTFRGGCGPNIAYSLALLGNRPKLLAAAGRDFGEFRQWLEAHGVDTSPMGIFEDEFTATFTVITDLDHNQIAGFHTGAMARARELSLARLNDTPIDVVIISPNDPVAMRQLAEECRQMGIPFVYDPSQQLARMTGEELVESMRGARVLTVNEYELEMAKAKSGLNEAGMLELVESIVVTLGPRGSRVLNRDGRVVEAPAAAARRVVEPTGVGDAFRAGLLTGLTRGYPWEVTCRLANLAAVYVIEHPGTMSHHYTLPEFVQRYRENFGDAPELEDLLRRGGEGK
ncbi:MAG: carbohydrate kinase family protein [Caldilineales bacterium]|nr:carbohydrate kinase family protein [Caldilineales bacterium]MDW8316497.1 carbohydrate kinase family protein [Anaerolineae bacterium]